MIELNTAGNHDGTNILSPTRCQIELQVKALRSQSIDESEGIFSIAELTAHVKDVFVGGKSKLERRHCISELLKRTSITSAEINKYSFWDNEKSYTRNLVSTDHENFTILFLCWNAGRESKIHDHPCDACFIKVLRGSIKETKYTKNSETNEITKSCVRFYEEGKVAYMDDYIGYHKITNPQKDMGCVSMHVYTPPFSQCKTWSKEGDADQFEVAKMGYYSVWGHRSPEQEGRPGRNSRLLHEIRAFQSFRNDSSASTSSRTTQISPP